MSEKRRGLNFGPALSHEDSVNERERVEIEKDKAKKLFLNEVRLFFESEISKNKNFHLTVKILDNYIKTNPDKFSGITNVKSLLYYFNNSLASLEIALGIRSVND